MSDFKIAFSIGDFHVYWYSIFMFFAFLSAYIASIVKCKIYKLPSAPVENFIWVLLPSAIVGARLWFILGSLNSLHSFWDIFKIWQGGIAIEGGLIAGVIVGIFWFYHFGKRYDVNYIAYADIIVPNILLAQSIGRWGNFFNQELLGNPVSGNQWSWLPNFIYSHLHIVGESSNIVRTPLFLIESFFTLLGWIILTFIIPAFCKNKYKINASGYAFLYLAYYGLLRAILEPFRDQQYQLMWGQLPVSIFLSCIFFVSGVVLFVLNQKQILINFLNKHLAQKAQA